MARRILVLGGTKYVGKHLVSKLLANGDDIFIATRGNNPIPNGCTFIKYDRDSKDVKLSINRPWDIVYDQSCYSSESLFNLKNVINSSGKYIFTSSQAVYPNGLNLEEDSIDLNDNRLISEYKINKYGLEKLKSEMYIYKNANHPMILRLPVVVGLNDPLQRVQNLISKISTNAIMLPQGNPLFNLIDEFDAAECLYQLSYVDMKGAINAASQEIISAEQCCQYLAKLLNIKLNINATENFDFSAFDLIKAESKTLSLKRQAVIGLNLKSAFKSLQEAAINNYERIKNVRI